MQIFDKQNEINFEEFSKTFPLEAVILKEIADEKIIFEITDTVLSLRSPYSNPIHTNIASKLDYHKKFFFKHSIHKEPLAKAVGIKKGLDKPHVLDATAGMLGDAILLHAMGCKVSAFERNPIAAALGINAIANSTISIPLTFGNAVDINNSDKKYDVIYFDPMYSDINEKTLPKKEMRIFREVIGIELDAELVARKLLTKSPRLVIKRPIKAPAIIAKPSFDIKGKSTRYDIYLNT